MKYNKIIIVDLEATCWATREESSRNTSEIIEIGTVLYNLDTCRIEKSDSFLVKPVNSVVSEFCTTLTTLTQEDVDDGMAFKTACDYLMNEYSSLDYPWASYGAYDRKMIDRQCKAHSIKNPMSDEHINVKLLYTLISPSHKRVGMEQALDALGIPLVGTHHRGIDDAKNITKILESILA
jgi:inhibitor of KinA sporulation pathway (predicted exonuclease)